VKEQLDSSRLSMGSPDSANHRSFRSSQLLARDEMRVFEPLFTRPDCHPRDVYFELLCQTLFRIRIWRYLGRRRMNPNASPKRLLMSYSKLARLVFGFGQTAEECGNNGRTINNWLRPSMARFLEVSNRELIRKVMRQSITTLDNEGDGQSSK
jgi:hypothetical protein